jgi:small subunit ribosomal protein S7
MRRRKAPEREVLPDPKYKSELVSKFINGLILKGKKSKAETIFYTAMDIIEQKMKQDPLVVFKKAMDNTAPILEVRSRLAGGIFQTAFRKNHGRASGQ